MFWQYSLRRFWLRDASFLTIIKKKDDSKPRITSISLAEGTRITSRELTISWHGNDAAIKFRYGLDGSVSAWTDSTSVSYTDLPEGPHLFSVTARGDSVTAEPVTRNFTIDVLDEPAVIFSPRRLTGITGVTVSIEGTDSLMAAHIEIACENASARILEFTPASSGNGQRVVLSDFSNPSRLVLDVGFTQPQESGSLITIGAMLVQPVQTGGRILIDQNNTILRDFNNEPIDINGFDEIQIGK